MRRASLDMMFVCFAFSNIWNKHRDLLNTFIHIQTWIHTRTCINIQVCSNANLNPHLNKYSYSDLHSPSNLLSYTNFRPHSNLYLYFIYLFIYLFIFYLFIYLFHPNNLYIVVQGFVIKLWISLECTWIYWDVQLILI